MKPSPAGRRTGPTYLPPARVVRWKCPPPRTGCQRRLALRARRRWRGRCAPGRPRQPGHCLARYALGAEGGGAARPGAYMCAPRNYARCLLGGVGMSKASCAARCSRGSVPGTPAEGEGGVAHREDLAATASTTLERSAGTVAHGTRGRRGSGVAAAPRSRAAGAPAARRRRAVGGACACRARSNGRRKPLGGGGGGGGWCAHQLRIT